MTSVEAEWTRGRREWLLRTGEAGTSVQEVQRVAGEARPLLRPGAGNLASPGHRPVKALEKRQTWRGRVLKDGEGALSLQLRLLRVMSRQVRGHLAGSFDRTTTSPGITEAGGDRQVMFNQVDCWMVAQSTGDGCSCNWHVA